MVAHFVTKQDIRPAQGHQGRDKCSGGKVQYVVGCPPKKRFGAVTKSAQGVRRGSVRRSSKEDQSGSSRRDGSRGKDVDAGL